MIKYLLNLLRRWEREAVADVEGIIKSRLEPVVRELANDLEAIGRRAVAAENDARNEIAHLRNTADMHYDASVAAFKRATDLRRLLARDEH